MHPFKYTRVSDESGALTALAGDEQALFLAGGTNVLDLMKLNVQAPSHLVDINQLPLQEISIQDEGVRIGALALNSDIAVHPVIRQRYPVLSEALLSGASPQLRNMATMGGNLLQRTRCPYFRDTAFPCNKRMPGTGCSAITGFNRQHAILGTSEHCIATHPSDLAVALVALDTIVHTRHAQGQRSIPLTDLYLTPGEHPERETVLEHAELITALELPALSFAHNSTYLKIRDRASYAFAIVSVAAALDIQGGTIRQARLALGGVATRPWRAYEAEQALVGQAPEDGNYQNTAHLALKGAIPQKDNAFKGELARRTIVRALQQVGARA